MLLVGRLGYLLGGAAVMRTTVALAAALALGIFAVPLAGDAQQATKLWRVGHLGYAYPTAAKDLEAFRHRLRLRMAASLQGCLTRTLSWLRAAADDSALVDRGQKNTERMLRALLGALGFEHVKVVFEEPPKT